MKVCTDCNKQFSDDTRFCSECGRQLESKSTPKQSRAQSSSGGQSGSGARGSNSGGRARSSRGGSRSSASSGSRSGGSASSANSANRSNSPRQGSSGGAQSAHGGGGRTDQADLIGRDFFGEYTITKRLGEGGMGAVYLAEQNSIDQKIALKVLHAETAESDEIVQRFHREAKVISMLTHPHIVRVFIFGRTDDDLLFLAMEYVEGIELREQLDGTPIDELRAIKIMKQVCSALAAAHDQQILHRDLKPENILLTEFRGEEDYVKILDFGIAKIKHPEGQQGPQLTQAGIVYGTPEYLSPEQAQAEDLDHRTDIYALGAMLFEMMTGRVPFDAEASVEILKQKVFEDPPRPTEYAPVAPTMEQIIMRAMAKDREDRFDDALEMFDALVARENELQRERELEADDTYVPGSELTGVHRAVSPEDNPIDAVQEQAAAAQQAVADTGDDLSELEQSRDSNQPGVGNQAAAGTSSTTSRTGAASDGGAGAEPPEDLKATTPRQTAPADTNPQQSVHPQQRQSTANVDPGQNIQGAPTQPTQQPNQGNATVRYLLIALVVVLGIAVVSLAVYLMYMVTS